MSDSGSAAGAEPDFTIELEMGISHADLFRLLPAAVEGRAFEREDLTIEIPVGSGSVRLEVSDQGERRLALIRLPVTKVRLLSFGLDQAKFDQFLKRFQRAYQKGGG